MACTITQVQLSETLTRQNEKMCLHLHIKLIFGTRLTFKCQVDSANHVEYIVKGAINYVN